MSVAQRLYESGHITYMRTDSVNLSESARESAQKSIIENYGENYSNPKKFFSHRYSMKNELKDCGRQISLVGYNK